MQQLDPTVQLLFPQMKMNPVDAEKHVYRFAGDSPIRLQANSTWLQEQLLGSAHIIHGWQQSNAVYLLDNNGRHGQRSSFEVALVSSIQHDSPCWRSPSLATIWVVIWHTLALASYCMLVGTPSTIILSAATVTS